MAKRDSYLSVCVNRREDGAPRGSCAARGSLEIHSALKEQLKEAGLAQLRARACSCSCLDVCGRGPVILVSPQNFFYGKVRLEDVPAIVEAVRTGSRVERLVLRDDEI